MGLSVGTSGPVFTLVGHSVGCDETGPEGPARLENLPVKEALNTVGLRPCIVGLRSNIER